MNEVSSLYYFISNESETFISNESETENDNISYKRSNP
jgi:hypothetical protein